jgi:hypothetical protein
MRLVGLGIYCAGSKHVDGPQDGCPSFLPRLQVQAGTALMRGDRRSSQQGSRLAVCFLKTDFTAKGCVTCSWKGVRCSRLWPLLIPSNAGKAPALAGIRRFTPSFGARKDGRVRGKLPAARAPWDTSMDCNAALGSTADRDRRSVVFQKTCFVRAVRMQLTFDRPVRGGWRTGVDFAVRLPVRTFEGAKNKVRHLSQRSKNGACFAQ